MLRAFDLKHRENCLYHLYDLLSSHFFDYIEQKNNSPRHLAKKYISVFKSISENANNNYKEYKYREYLKQKQIYHNLIQTGKKNIDFVDLLPEFKLRDKLVCTYDPIITSGVRLIDLLPFFEKIVCVIRMANYWNNEAFKTTYGISYKDFLELTDMGIVIPVIDNNPNLDSWQYDFFSELWKKEVPEYTRYCYILERDFCGESDIQQYLDIVYHKILRPMTVYVKNVYNDPIITQRLIRIVNRAIRRGDLGSALLQLMNILTFFDRKDFIVNRQTTLDIAGIFNAFDQWHELAYISPGSTIIYEDVVIDYLHKTNEKKQRLLDYCFEDLDIPIENMQRMTSLSEYFPSIAGKLLAVIRQEYFFEPPIYYKEPVTKYANWLKRSDNIGEHFKIAASIMEHLRNGNLHQAQEIYSGNAYKKIIKEINKEVKKISKTSKVLQYGWRFGVTLSGTFAANLATQQLKDPAFRSLILFFSAIAALESVSICGLNAIQHSILPLFSKSNAAMMIWRHKKHA